MRVCVLIGAGRDVATLMFVPDPEKKRRALAHGRGYALSHVEKTLPPSLRDDVIGLGRAFSREAGQDGNVVAFVREYLARNRSRAAVLRALKLPVGELFPRVSGALRVGEPKAGELFPFDAEVAGLLAGSRRLIKRDGLLPEEVFPARAHFAKWGLFVEEGREADGRIVLFAAKERGIVGDAMAWESQLGGRGEEAERAARNLGEALGYPDCCVAAFSRLSARDDLSLALALLPEQKEAPASPYSLWLAPTLALVSHAPCSLECEKTMTLGKKLCAALELDRPGFGGAWLSLAQRIVVLTVTGKLYALKVEGEMVFHAVDAGPEGVFPALPGVKRFFGEWIEDEKGERVEISLLADHRGVG